MSTDNRVVYVHGATGPDLKITVRRAGRLHDLTPYLDGSITAVISRGAEEPIEKVGTIDADPTTGVVRFAWVAGDLVAATEDVIYEGDLYLDDGATSEIAPDRFRFKVRPAIPAPVP